MGQSPATSLLEFHVEGRILTYGQKSVIDKFIERAGRRVFGYVKLVCNLSAGKADLSIIKRPM